MVPPSYFFPTGVECHTPVRRDPACVPPSFSCVGVCAAPHVRGSRCSSVGPVLTDLLVQVCPRPLHLVACLRLVRALGGGGGLTEPLAYEVTGPV